MTEKNPRDGHHKLNFKIIPSQIAKSQYTHAGAKIIHKLEGKKREKTS
jgi:hypothetical protein